MPDHAHFSPPAVCERLADMLPRFGGTREHLKTGAGHARIAYPLPAHAAAEVRRFLEPFTISELEPDYIARLPGGRVFGAGVVLSPDGRSIARDVSTDFGKSFEDHWLLACKKIRPPVRVSGSIAVVAVTLGEGYCHWLLEELPRLLMLDSREHASVIAHTEAPFIREALSFGRFAGRFLEARRYSHFECEQLIIPSLVGRAGCPTPQVVQLLTDFTAPLRSKVPPGFGDRLYITREKAGRRRVTNEPELWSQLAARGFAKVRVEELSWRDQINAFAHAKVVVAPHGAGLANLVFCQPGVRVVELFNGAYINPCFWRLAGVLGLDYRPVVPSVGEVLGYDPKANRNDIHVDVNAVMTAVD